MNTLAKQMRSALIVALFCTVAAGAKAQAYPSKVTDPLQLGVALSELLSIPNVTVGTDASLDRGVLPAHKGASDYFHLAYRAARRALLRYLPAPSDWTDREKALVSDCIAAQAGAVLATRHSAKSPKGAPATWLQQVRKRNVALATFLSESKTQELNDRRGRSSNPQTHGMFLSEQEFEDEQVADIWPWFDRDIAFLALSGGSAYAFDLLGSQGLLVLPKAWPKGLLDKRAGDTFLSWSARQCARLMFIRSAHVDYVEVTISDVKERDTPTGRVSSGTLQIHNVGAHRLVGSTLVVLFSDDPADEVYDPAIQEIVPVEFDLVPLGNTISSITLAFRNEGRRIPRLMTVGPDNSPTSVQALGEAMNIGTCVERVLGTDDAPALLKVLAQYAADAPRGFATTMSGHTDKWNLSAQGKVPVPGAQNTVVHDFSKSKSMKATMFAGDAEGEARAVFEATLSTIRGFCGQEVGDLDRNPDGPKDVSVYSIKMFSPQAEMRLQLQRETSKAESIHPAPYSVTVSVVQHWRLFP